MLLLLKQNYLRGGCGVTRMDDEDSEIMYGRFGMFSNGEKICFGMSSKGKRLLCHRSGSEAQHPEMAWTPGQND